MTLCCNNFLLNWAQTHLNTYKYKGEPGTKIAIDIHTDRQNSSKKATKEKLNVNIMLSGDITSQIWDMYFKPPL